MSATGPAEINSSLTFLSVSFRRISDLSCPRPGASQVAWLQLELLLAGVCHRFGAVPPPAGHSGMSAAAGCLAAFRRPADALAAACALAQAAMSGGMPGMALPEVCIALHCGHDDGAWAASAAVRRCVALRDAAHGGEILLSELAQVQVRSVLPAGVRLRSLGLIRLKDLTFPEHVFQLIHPDLLVDFPPPQSLSQVPNNLPVQPNRLIGRAGETATLRAHLARTGLLTLTGPPGCGKTRLALEVAADVADAFPGGAWVVDLVDLADPDRLDATAAAVLRLRKPGLGATRADLKGYLQTQFLLLVLDGCEHLAEACALFAHDLLRTCPGLCILATSQEPLDVAGENLWPVRSLPVPDPEHAPPSELAAAAAVELFMERARAISPHLMPDEAGLRAVAHICQAVDGLPLAIEHAALWVRALPLNDLANIIGGSLQTLELGSHRAPPRHRTLRTALNRSHGLLPPPEQALLRRLAVFSGGFSLAAAEAVCAGSDVAATDVLELLARLISKSLVQADVQGREARYRLLGIIRCFAWEQLKQCGEEADLRRTHRDWFLATGESMAAGPGDADPADWLARLRQERKNLQAALAWSRENGETALVGRLAAAMLPYSSPWSLPTIRRMDQAAG